MSSSFNLRNFGKFIEKEGDMINEKHIIKVDKEITPVHYTKRKEPVLEVGADYYVSFGNNIVYPCTLNEIIESIPRKIVISKYDNGKLFGKHVLFSNEIGQTPEEAVINSVTF
jgi:hypothetical protein